ncbi:hypothetical protein V5O48_019120 [Marasmius crinis-equi]|uniref:Uncharacterized protein n=1 Tax=Marasmius crinis-equi TaxID=585013 RepID=A0ABR3EJA3_9AGAR
MDCYPGNPKVCLVSVTAHNIDIEISPTGEELRNAGSRPSMTITLDAAQIAESFLIRLQFPNAVFRSPEEPLTESVLSPTQVTHEARARSPAQLSEYSTTEPDSPIPQIPAHLLRSPSADSVTESDNSPLCLSTEPAENEHIQSPIHGCTERDEAPCFDRTSLKTVSGEMRLNTPPSGSPTVAPKRLPSNVPNRDSPEQPDNQKHQSPPVHRGRAGLTPERRDREVNMVIPMKRSAIDPEYANIVETSQDEEVEVRWMAKTGDGN